MEKTFIKEARELAGITQAAMAKLIGIKQGSYSHKENHDNFNWSEQKKLMKALGEEVVEEARRRFAESQVQEDQPRYSNDYTKLLAAVKQLEEQHEFTHIALAKILSELKGKDFATALKEIKAIYSKETSKKGKGK